MRSKHLSGAGSTRGLSLLLGPSWDPPVTHQLQMSRVLSPWSLPMVVLVVLLLTSPSPVLQDVAVTAVRSSLTLSPKPIWESEESGKMGT